MTILRVPYLLIVFVIALFAGYNVGEDLDPLIKIFGQQMEPESRPRVKIPNNDQYNILIIGVDDMEKEDAQLESVWLVAHVRNSSRVTLIPIFPSPDIPDQNINLPNSFHIEDGRPGIEFWDAMRETNLWWKGYLVSDTGSSENLIDALGGVDINNQRMSGVQAVSNITSWRENPDIAVDHQKMLLESLCHQFWGDQTTNKDIILELMDHALHANLKTKITLTRWVTKSASDGNLTCEFPTLVRTSIHSTSVTP